MGPGESARTWPPTARVALNSSERSLSPPSMSNTAAASCAGGGSSTAHKPRRSYTPAAAAALARGSGTHSFSFSDSTILTPLSAALAASASLWSRPLPPTGSLSFSHHALFAALGDPSQASPGLILVVPSHLDDAGPPNANSLLYLFIIVCVTTALGGSWDFSKIALRSIHLPPARSRRRLLAL